MSESTSQPPNINDINESLRRLSEKISLIQDAVRSLNQQHSQLEGKIEDAQKRIQHILSRLPEQSDGRQLNLLGEPASTTNPEDDSEPTTH